MYKDKTSWTFKREKERKRVLEGRNRRSRKNDVIGICDWDPLW